MRGDSFVDSGTLVREAGGFVLRRDSGGAVLLELNRLPVDHVEKKVFVTGIYVEAGRVEVRALRPA
ncbi:DUF5818 domain-containing protein [Sphingomonas morindae]|uniref:DUF5818 domain-containing protein n=1 Tax=Sphingomonas morindae TaxID=1541170 RepID=A0ABY4XA59_9SPHN|nr:DUF5818 domain-containing protein [Sphingomonas morindae]USI73840.1 DUF5818 domain-containing protein [Sphingomonas morindae]